MPRRSILSVAERESLLALPDSKDDLIRHYSFSDADLTLIGHRSTARICESAALRCTTLLHALSRCNTCGG